MRRSKAPTQLKKKSTTGYDAISNNRSNVSSNNLNNSTTTNKLSSNQQSNQYQIFSVVYGQFKPGKKKKEWTNDGVLERNNKSIKIYNEEGECIENNQYTKDRPLRPDDTLLFGSKEYMIIDPIKVNDFNSKKCFVNYNSINNQSNETINNSIDDENLNKSSLKRKNESDTPFKCPLKIPKTEDNNFANEENSAIENFNLNQSTIEENRFQHIKSISDQNELYQVFTIIYGQFKPGKKRKEYNNDGILVRKGCNLMLYNMDGDKIESEIIEKKNRLLKCGDEFVAFSKEIQINDLIKIEDFENGNCFLTNFVPDVTIKNQDNKITSNEIKTAFKCVLTDQTKNVQKINNNDNDLEFDTEIFMLPKVPDELCKFNQIPKPIICDYELSSVLREHQREGIVFMYKCIMGFFENIEGCILADEMGLGKTLQCIVLIYTLLKDGPFNVPFFDRVCILAPSSLVKNWAKEFDKWLKNKRLYCYAVDGKKHTVKHYLKQSKSTYPILIISYEMFYRNRKSLEDLDFSLIVCDEGHCLKNEKVKLFKTIESLNCKKRIIITGTPVQNNLIEIYNLSNLACPGILGSREEFHKQFEEPIEEAQRSIDKDNSAESVLNKTNIEEDIYFKLFQKLNEFVLRREHSMFNLLLKKIENVIICKLTPIQEEIYNLLLNDKILKKILSEEDDIRCNTNSCLPYISFLRKLSNHPYLVKSELIKKSYELKENSLINQLSNQIDLIFQKYPKGVLEKSGKFNVLAKILEIIKEKVQDKVVIVSHFTQTLDLIETFCRYKNYSFLRLDGSTPAANRQKLVDEFNTEYSKKFIFLLSSKAGGLGLNLIGASHIILYDIDWNPAYDQQSMARIWRDGQKKISNIYRLLSVGTIDEKIFQRQLIKQNLNSAFNAGNNDLQLSTKDIKDIFTLNLNTLSTTHDSIDCNCLNDNNQNDNDSITDDEKSMDDNSNGSEENQFNDQNDDEFINNDSQNVQSQIRVKIKKENRTFSDNELDLEIAQDETSNDSANNQLKTQLSQNDNYSQDEDDNRRQNEIYTDNTSYSDYSYEFKSIIANDKDQIIKRDFENDDEEIVDEFDNDCNDDLNQTIERKIGLSKNAKKLIKNKPISEWQHFAAPFDNSDMSSILFQASDNMTFVFKTETD